MSTRCHIGFYDAKVKDLHKWEALLYRHSDGYPGTPDGKEYGVLTDIVPFLKEYPRPDDAEYRACRMLQHLCNEYDAEMRKIEAKQNSLGFYSGVIGYGICRDFHGDHEYYYAIYPDRIDVYSCGFDAPPEKWKKIETVSLKNHPNEP